MKRRSFFAALAGLLAAPHLIEKVKTWDWRTLRLRKIEYSGSKPNIIIWSKSVEDDYMAMEAARRRPPINYASIADFKRWLRYNLAHGGLRLPITFTTDRFRYPSHFALAGGNSVVYSPEMRDALLAVERKLQRYGRS